MAGAPAEAAARRQGCGPYGLFGSPAEGSSAKVAAT
jgi:hypothetical protein